ncbi:hypothetical protein FB192DRAFT_1316017 [Mucor lusitanicus]|uniref:Formin GTPase-binding domain-containing protein n=1 Tax=Mucor circinelloides f. lusitanicus TaxID=29924 RepID=A0A8H4BRM0_MUCCL|nr:hypothetical protein FB192DRAFT_1316017 [Mucor lusitanicus]
MVDKRAATYKYARKNLTSTIRSNRSKVGSMVLEFDALANKLEDTASDESAAWLLLDNKTLPRHYNMNTGTTRSNHINHHPSVSNLFPTASTTTINTPSETTSSVHVAETSASSSLLSNSYAYQSLSRKDGSHLASLVSSSSPALDDTIKRGRDRNSPYYYVERIKSRNTTTDALTKHLTSLRITLATGNVSWINEFLSRRHGGLIALENVLDKLTSKKQK